MTSTMFRKEQLGDDSLCSSLRRELLFPSTQDFSERRRLNSYPYDVSPECCSKIQV